MPAASHMGFRQSAARLPDAWNRLRVDQRREKEASDRIRSQADSLSALDPVASADVAGLRYVDDTSTAGIRRIGRGHRYLDPRGRAVSSRQVVQRIKALAISPAWRDVWICPDPLGPCSGDRPGCPRQEAIPLSPAVAGPARRSEIWQAARVCKSTPAHPRPHVRRPAPNRSAPREGAGRRGSAPRENTDPNRERRVRPAQPLVRPDDPARQARQGDAGGRPLRVPGKERHRARRRPARCAAGASRAEMPGPARPHPVPVHRPRRPPPTIDSADVNAYLREITGDAFTAKDFRTWAGTVLAAQELSARAAFRSQRDAKSHVLRAVESVARRLGNTRAVCRKSYIHPAVLAAYMDGETLAPIAPARSSRSARVLAPIEFAVVRVIRRRLQSRRD